MISNIQSYFWIKLANTLDKLNGIVIHTYNLFYCIANEYQYAVSTTNHTVIFFSIEICRNVLYSGFAFCMDKKKANNNTSHVSSYASQITE